MPRRKFRRSGLGLTGPRLLVIRRGRIASRVLLEKNRKVGLLQRADLDAEINLILRVLQNSFDTGQAFGREEFFASSRNFSSQNTPAMPTKLFPSASPALLMIAS